MSVSKFDISLSCRCGAVHGHVVGAGIKTALRFVCYCDDCKAFAHYLKREDVILDELGGTDIYQVASYHVKLTKGANQLRCVMLRKKGLFRWFTQCCNTPIGTTMSDKVAVCGINHCFIKNVSYANEFTGPIRLVIPQCIEN